MGETRVGHYGDRNTDAIGMRPPGERVALGVPWSEGFEISVPLVKNGAFETDTVPTRAAPVTRRSSFAWREGERVSKSCSWP